jgi:hypothetical protein
LWINRLFSVDNPVDNLWITPVRPVDNFVDNFSVLFGLWIVWITPYFIHRLMHRQNIEFSSKTGVFHSIHSPYYYYYKRQ